jgi:phage terminase Nu1 subunit (DNA packaging protein)
MGAGKEHGISIGVNQIITYATLIPILWFVGQPIIVDAMAEDIKAVVQQSTEPMQNAFTVLLLRDINALKREIAADEFRQGQEGWTAADSVRLADKKIELQALQEALGELQEEGE